MGEPRVSAAAGISVTKVSWGGVAANNLEHTYFTRSVSAEHYLIHAQFKRGPSAEHYLIHAQFKRGASAEHNLEHAYFKRGRECVAGFHNCGVVAQAANGGGHWFKADKAGACWRIDLHERIAAEKFHFNSLLLRNDGGS